MDHLNTLHSLCEVLGIDFKQTVHEVHPSLDEAEGSKNLSNTTIERLALAVDRLREIKIQRMQKVSIFCTILQFEICVAYLNSILNSGDMNLSASRLCIDNARTMESYGYTN